MEDQITHIGWAYGVAMSALKTLKANEYVWYGLYDLRDGSGMGEEVVYR